MRAFFWYGRAPGCVCCLLAAACGGARPSAGTVREALDAMRPSQRRGTLEATTAALDERPKYVDELYVIARQHPRTFNRVLANTVRDLRVPENSRRTAELLASDPDAFEQMMVTTLEVVQQNPVARARLTRAMVRKRAIVADLLTDRPDALVPIMNATMEQVRKKPKARVGLRSSLEQSSKAVAPVLMEDPDTLGTLLQALLDAGMDLEDAVDALDQPDKGDK